MLQRMERRIFTFVGLILFVSVGKPAFAYLDPGSGSMALQIILGGLAGLALLARYIWIKFLSGIGIKRNKDTSKTNSSHDSKPL